MSVHQTLCEIPPGEQGQSVSQATNQDLVMKRVWAKRHDQGAFWSSYFAGKRPDALTSGFLLCVYLCLSASTDSRSTAWTPPHAHSRCGPRKLLSTTCCREETRDRTGVTEFPVQPGQRETNSPWGMTIHCLAPALKIESGKPFCWSQ